MLGWSRTSPSRWPYVATAKKPSAAATGTTVVISSGRADSQPGRDRGSIELTLCQKGSLQANRRASGWRRRLLRSAPPVGCVAASPGPHPSISDPGADRFSARAERPLPDGGVHGLGSLAAVAHLQMALEG